MYYKIIILILSLLVSLIGCEEKENIDFSKNSNEINEPEQTPHLRNLSGKNHYGTAYEPVYVQKMQYVPAKTYKKVMYTAPEKSTYTVPYKQQMRYVPVGYAKGVPSTPKMYVPVTKAEPNVYVPVTYSKGMRYLEESSENEFIRE